MDIMRNPTDGKNFFSHTLLLIAGCILFNILGARLATFSGLPLFLDTAGTIIGAALGGYLAGVSIGFLSNALNSLVDPITLYYGLLNVCIAIAAAFLARRKVFSRYSTTLLSSLLFAFIGGGLGSLVTWGLYGLNMGEGISGPFVDWLNTHTAMGSFFSQVSADVVIDIFDKAVTVTFVFGVLRILRKFFPELVLHTPIGGSAPEEGGEDAGVCNEFHSPSSLRNKLAIVIVIMSLFLSILAVSISTVLYVSTTDQHYESFARAIADLMRSELDVDELEKILIDRKVTPEYRDMKSRLEVIQKSFHDVKYMYVYKIMDNGCMVVFDLDTPGLPGGRLGDIVSFDDAFLPYLPLLKAGGELPPIVSHGQFGWLLTMYRPVRNSAGHCIAYAAVDIAMDDVIADRSSFVIRMVMLLFGASILVVACVFWYAQNKLVIPINSLARATNTFAYDSETHREKSSTRLQALSIHTGDEIENLYKAIVKTTADVSQFITLIDEQSAEVRNKADIITRMQDNIILSFADMVECRDENTGSHIRHTAAYVGALAWELQRKGYYRGILTPEYIQKLVKSAPLHDVGKIKVPDALLNKPGKLTPEEFEIMKKHTIAGGEILREALVGIRDDNYLSEAINMATYHHERWDGKGYPCGLAGEAIPLSARVMALADVFDALISRRSYKEAFSFEKSMDIIKSEAGTHFDPVLAETFVELAGTIRSIVLSSR